MMMAEYQEVADSLHLLADWSAGELYEESMYVRSTCESGATIIQKLLKELAAYEGAEEHGLLVRLPCKIGTDCWRVNFNRRRHPIEQIRFDVTSYNAFGKTVFLSRAEAEAALKGEDCDAHT